MAEWEIQSRRAKGLFDFDFKCRSIESALWRPRERRAPRCNVVNAVVVIVAVVVQILDPYRVANKGLGVTVTSIISEVGHMPVRLVYTAEVNLVPQLCFPHPTSSSHGRSTILSRERRGISRSDGWLEQVWRDGVDAADGSRNGCFSCSEYPAGFCTSTSIPPCRVHDFIQKFDRVDGPA